MNAALCIFVKNLRPGQVKTRLAAGVGDERAMDIYKTMLQHTCTICSPLPVDKYVFYSEVPEAQDMWGDRFEKRAQGQGDLGARMQDAFTMLFETGYEKVGIIGSDCMELTSGMIITAFERLMDHDVVIGPALDGGYYLLGLKEIHPAIFTGIAWSTERVLEQTLKTCDEHRLSYALLQPLRDIDREEDWLEFLQKSQAVPG